MKCLRLRQYYNFELSYVKPNYHYGYVGAAIDYSRLPGIIRKGIARVVLPIEVRLEKRFELGASFYFEAKKLEIVKESVECILE